MVMNKLTETVNIPKKTNKDIILNAYEMDMDNIFRNSGIECDKQSVLNKKTDGRTIDGKFQSSVKPTTESINRAKRVIQEKYNVKVSYNDKTGEISVKGKY